MQLDLISERNLRASCKFGVAYEIEDLLVKYCNANLINPVPREIYKKAISNPSPLSKVTLKLLGKTIKNYRPVTVDASSESGPKVLGIVALNGSSLNLLDVIKNWRQQYDLVFAYVLDCWMLEAYPKFVNQLDQIFIPFPELQPSLQENLGCPVSVIPYAANNLWYSSASIPRSIDVVSYGRVANNYHQGLFNNFDANYPDLFYYEFGVGASVKDERFPKLDWGRNRFDYQNRMSLPRLLRRSKIALAFHNLYTKSVNEGNKHVINRAEHSFLTLRWFESSGAGCAMVGKHPSSSLSEKYMGWDDAFIELPDDVDEGISMIHSLLEDKYRLSSINQRNFLENLALNDWCYRFKTMLDILELPVPESLTENLKLLDQLYSSYKNEISYAR